MSICSRDPITPMSGVKIFVAGPDVWRPVLGYEGLYEVSGHGELKALARTLTRSNGQIVQRVERILKCSKNAEGRRSARLVGSDGAERRMYVYVLVAEAFLGPRPAGLQVGHRNDICSDDRIANLHYVTNQENSFEKTANGRDPDANKTHCKRGHEFIEGSFRVKLQGKTVGRECIACEKIRNDEKYAKVRAARTAGPPAIGRKPIGMDSHCSRGHEFTPETTRVRMKDDKPIGRICVPCEKLRNDEKYAKVKDARDAAKPRRSED